MYCPGSCTDEMGLLRERVMFLLPYEITSGSDVFTPPMYNDGRIGQKG